MLLSILLNNLPTKIIVSIITIIIVFVNLFILIVFLLNNLPTKIIVCIITIIIVFVNLFILIVFLLNNLPTKIIVCIITIIIVFVNLFILIVFFLSLVLSLKFHIKLFTMRTINQIISFSMDKQHRTSDVFHTF